MKYLKQLLLFTIIFTVTFIANGEAYIYYLNSAANDCNYYFECQITSSELREKYSVELKELGAELDLAIYAIDYKPISANSARYEIYAIDDKTTELLKEKLRAGDKTKFKSLFSGNIEIRFKDISKIQNNSGISLYNVIGNEENVQKLRSITIDEYGTGKPYEGGYKGDHFLIVITSWGLAYVIILFMSIVESLVLRREICLKYINGYDWYKLQLNIIGKKTIVILISATIGLIVANLFTEASAFGVYLLFAVIGAIVISASIFIWNFRLIDIRKVFGTDLYSSRLQRCTSMVLLSVTLTLFILSSALCMQNLVNAGKTIGQKNIWSKYDDYKSVTFFSKEETDTANHHLDNQYAKEFYQHYLHKYDISLAFNIAQNGGMNETVINDKYHIVYMNLNGAKKVNLPIDVSLLREESFYIISPFYEEKLKKKNMENDLRRLIESLSNNRKEPEIEPVYIKKPYEVTLLDIKNDDLAQNCVKNPVIVIDTHKTIDEEFAENVCTGIMKFESNEDFKNFIDKINYEDQVWYEDNVYQLYEEKRNSCIMTASINAIIAVTLLLLFYITLYTVLKIEFQYRAEEISIRKILGDSFIRRYFFVFKILNIVIISTTIVLLLLNSIIAIIDIKYMLITLSLVYILLFLLFVIFVSVYENQNIPKVLKGGY